MSEINKNKKPWFLSFQKKNDDENKEKALPLLNDLKSGFDVTGELKIHDESFKKLFDESAIDEEAEQNFQKIEKERRRRLETAVESSGANIEDIRDELGFVAPIPVTSDTIIVDEILKENNQADDFQKALIDTAVMPTMEIKLNVLNDTVEVQSKRALPKIDEETINAILEKAKGEEEPEQTQAVAPNGEFEDIKSSTNAVNKENKTAEVGKAKLIAQFEGGQQVYKTSEADIQQTVFDLQIPLEENTKNEVLTDITKYRSKNSPLHIVNMNILQQVINKESKSLPLEQKNGPIKKSTSKIKQAENVEEIHQEFDNPKEIANKLRKQRSLITGKLLLTAVIAIFTLVFTLINESGFAVNNTETQKTFIYLTVNLAALLIVFWLNFNFVIQGIKNLFELKPNGDTTISLAMFAGILQASFAFFNQNLISQGYAYVYGVVILTGVFLNLLGKLFIVRRVYGNFRFINSKEEKYAVNIFDNEDIAIRLSGNSVVGAPCIAYQKKASYLKNFLDISFEPDPAQTSGGVLTPICLIFSLILCLVSMIAYKDVFMGLSVFTAACCVTVAMGNMMSANIPISKLCKNIRRSSAMVSGYKAIKQIANVNAVMLDCADIFPSGTVALEGFKTYSAEDEEECMTFTVAMLTKVGGTLSEVMEEIVQNSDEELPKVYNLAYEEDYGMTAMINGKNVIIGNRTLLLNHNITAPERDEVVKYTGEGKKVVFVAIDGKLRAMIILSYKADKRKIKELQTLEENGISVLIRTTDPNITQNMISTMFGISKSSISIIAGDLGVEYENLVNKKAKGEDAFVATKGRAESLMSVISQCASKNKIITFIVAVQIVGIILGLVLVSFLAVSKEFSILTSVNLLIYQVFWVLVSLLAPKK